MGFCGGIVKGLLFIFNLVFALGGITLVCLGAVIIWNINKFDAFFKESDYAGSILLICVGGAITIISLFGCMVTSRNSGCLLITYSSLLGISCAALAAGALLSGLVLDGMFLALRSTMFDLLFQYPGQPHAQEVWDLIQPYHHCCGVYGPADWLQSPPGLAAPPASCACTPGPAELPVCENNVYMHGCYDSLHGIIWTLQVVMACMAGLLAVCAVCGTLLSCAFSKTTRKQRV